MNRSAAGGPSSASGNCSKAGYRQRNRFSLGCQSRCTAFGREVVDVKVGRQPQLAIDADERVDAAARAALDDAHQLPRGRFAEVRREVGDHQHVERLGHFAGLGVVFVDRRELVAEIFLQHRLHVVGEPRELLFDLPRLGPDAAGDELLVVVGQVHERRRSSRPGRRGRGS